MSYACKIICDSLAPNDKRLTTFEVTFPRFILAEVNTHRALSRNSASSRAIPVEKQIRRVLEDPFIPERWPINEKGMQSNSFYEIDSDEHRLCVKMWLMSRDNALRSVRTLIGRIPINHGNTAIDENGQTELHVHKAIANRLLEPFMWHTAILTATEWSNFFALRAHPDAQPEFQKLAYMMKEQYEDNRPNLVPVDWRHMPYINDEDFQEVGRRFSAPGLVEKVCQISVARCCRVSYLTHDGKRDIEEDLALFERLRTSVPAHMSPFEHVAQTMGPDDAHVPSGNFYGWRQFRKDQPNECL